MEQNLNSNKNEFLWTLLANQANDAHLHTYDLQRLVNDFPQSGILQALLAHASDEKNLRRASVYFSPRSLYKLINAPTTLTGVPDEKIIIQPGISSNGYYHQHNAPAPVEAFEDTVSEGYFDEHTPAVETEQETSIPEADQEHTNSHEGSATLNHIESWEQPQTEPGVESNEDTPADNQVDHEHAAVAESPLAETPLPSDQLNEEIPATAHETVDENIPADNQVDHEHTEVPPPSDQLNEEITATAHETVEATAEDALTEASSEQPEQDTHSSNEPVNITEQEEIERPAAADHLDNQTVPVADESTEPQVFEDAPISAPADHLNEQISPEPAPAEEAQEPAQAEHPTEDSSPTVHPPEETELTEQVATPEVVDQPINQAGPESQHAEEPIADRVEELRHAAPEAPLSEVAEAQQPSSDDIDETYDEIVGIEDINFSSGNNSASGNSYFSFDKEFGEHTDETSVENEQQAADTSYANTTGAKNDAEHQDVSKYHDEKMPYSFMWWLDKTRKEHAQIYQPYVKPPAPPANKKAKKITDELQQQYFENIFHITSVDELDKNTPPPPTRAPYNFKPKEQIIIERFIKEEPQIRPQSSDKIDNENKAKKSSEDRDELVTETLAAIYSDQMLYHKAIASYKKLMLRFPEKSRYFAEKIEQLEKKTN